MEAWYALHTKPNSEYQVATVLRERGIETYLPQVEAPKSRRRQKMKPFFPCYLFIKVDFKELGLSQVRWTPGLRRIVSFNDRPVAVPEEMIDLVRRQLGEIEAAGGWAAYHFRPGDTVRITAGPFRDIVAVFERTSSSAERVRVLLEILGRTSRMEVAAADLEKVEPGAEEPRSKRPRRTRGRGRRIKSSGLPLAASS